MAAGDGISVEEPADCDGAKISFKIAKPKPEAQRGGTSPPYRRPRPLEEDLSNSWTSCDDARLKDIEAEGQHIYHGLVDIICQELSFELHRELHTGVMSVEELHTDRRRDVAFRPDHSTGGDIYGRSAPKDAGVNLKCPGCARMINVARYAPHLDKCLMGAAGRGRATRAKSPTPPRGLNAAGAGLPKKQRTEAKPAAGGAGDKKKRPLRIKIKLENGVPIQTHQRLVVQDSQPSSSAVTHPPPHAAPPLDSVPPTWNSFA